MYGLLKTTVLLICLIMADGLAAQSNYIVVGQKDSMIYTQFVPPVHFSGGGGPFVTQFSGPSIDLNHDGINDFTFSSTNSSPLGNGGTLYEASLQITLSTNCYLSCGTFNWYDSNYPYFEGDVCQYGYSTIARTYLNGDTLRFSDSTIWRSEADGVDTCVAVNNTGGFGYGCILIDSTSITTGPGCICFMLINGGDTLLGYMHLSGFSATSTSTSVYLYDFAIQGHQEADTIDGVNVVNSAPDVRVFPSPFNDVLHVQGDRQYVYSLYDMNGALIKTGTGSEIDTRLLSSGVYVLELRNESGVVTKKVVKTEAGW